MELWQPKLKSYVLLVLLLGIGTLHIIVKWDDVQCSCEPSTLVQQETEPLWFSQRDTGSQILSQNDLNKIVKKSVEDTHPFKHDNVECSVLAYETQAEFDVYKSNIPYNATDSCTLKTFQDYFRKKNHFLSDGAWNAPGGQIPTARFHPLDCNFDSSQIAKGRLKECIIRRKIKKILVYGDSNGYRQWEQVIEYFQNRSVKCESQRTQKDEPYGKAEPYFEVPGAPMMVTFKGCWECRHQIHKCIGVDVDPRAPMDVQLASTVVLEYIGVGAFMMTNRRTFPNKGMQFLENPILPEDTPQEFFLQRYFKHHGFPDLWLFSPPIHHEAADHTREQMIKDIRDLMKLFDHYVPKTTTLLMLSNIRMCSSLSGWTELQDFMNKKNMTKNHMMHIMNQILFDELKTRFVEENTNVQGFMDFGDLTCPLSCMWHMDGAHMQKQYYGIIIKHILEYLCAE